MNTFIDPVCWGELAQGVQEWPVHLRLVYRAASEHGCTCVAITQGQHEFGLDRSGRPLIILVGDDFNDAFGPSGFHLPSISRLIAQCEAAVIVSSGPALGAYGGAAEFAAEARRNVVLVETRPEREDEWVDFIKICRPGTPLVLFTPDPKRARLRAIRCIGGVQ